jgi:hypothetical protein
MIAGDIIGRSLQSAKGSEVSAQSEGKGLQDITGEKNQIRLKRVCSFYQSLKIRNIQAFLQMQV